MATTQTPPHRHPEGDPHHHDHDHHHHHDHGSPSGVSRPSKEELLGSKENWLLGAEGLGVMRGNRWIIQGIDFGVATSEVAVIVGPNGAGKSTLLRALLGIYRPTSGRVFRKKGIKIGLVPQQLETSPVIPLTVGAFVQSHPDVKKSPVAYRLAMETFDVLHLASRLMSRLSGGEWQRVLLARACASSPDILVLDEPARGLDMVGENQLYTAIDNYRQRAGFSVLMVSHDWERVMRTATKVLCLDQVVCCIGRPQDIFPIDQSIWQTSRGEALGSAVSSSLARFQHAHHPSPHVDHLSSNAVGSVSAHDSTAPSDHLRHSGHSGDAESSENSKHPARSGHSHSSNHSEPLASSHSPLAPSTKPTNAPSPALHSKQDEASFASTPETPS